MKSLIPAAGAEELISKAVACEILDRCDSTLSKWAYREGYTRTECVIIIYMAVRGLSIRPQLL